MSSTERMRAMGIDPIVPLGVVAAAVGLSTTHLQRLAAERPDELQIVRVSERRMGVRKSVLDAFMANCPSVVKRPDLRGRCRERRGRSAA